MTYPQIVGIIPARIASSRFPKKMLADVFGKSLIERTYENTCRAHLLSEVVVATDDPTIFAHVASFGGNVVLTSPKCPTGSDRVAEAAKTHYPQADIVVNIQGDEPCLDPKVIDQVVELLLQNPKSAVTTAAALVTSSKQAESPSCVKCVFDKKGKALYFSRAPIPFAQGKEGIFYRHIGIYAFRYQFLTQFPKLDKTPCQQAEDLEQLKILEHGFPIHIAVVKDQAIGIDTPEDLEVIKKILV